jgi:hypothetical protein
MEGILITPVSNVYIFYQNIDTESSSMAFHSLYPGSPSDLSWTDSMIDMSVKSAYPSRNPPDSNKDRRHFTGGLPAPSFLQS